MKLYDLPVVNKSGNIIIRSIPDRILNTGLPITGKILPKNHAGIEIIKQSRMPGSLFTNLNIKDPSVFVVFLFYL